MKIFNRFLFTTLNVKLSTKLMLSICYNFISNITKNNKVRKEKNAQKEKRF